MVMTSNSLSRRVKGEGVFEKALPEQFPTPPHTERQQKSSARRRDHLHEQERDHFITLSMDRHGRTHITSSASLTQYREYIMELAYPRFKEVLPRRSFLQRTHSEVDLTALQLMPPAVASFMPPEDNTGNISYAFPQRRAKRRRSSTVATGRNSGSDNEHSCDARSVLPKTRKTIEILVGDSAAMEKWYKDAFHAVQQVSCRLVAKLWIKRIHLKKQSTHPYNGGYPKDVPRDPARTKPYYWPRDVRHKEPDHITRDERVSVLMNIIQMSPLEEINSPDERQHLINTRHLLEALEERRNDIPDDKWEILEEIAKARTLQEQLNRNEIDPETVVELIDCSADTRRAQGESDDDIDDPEGGHLVPQVEAEAEVGQNTEDEPSVTLVSSHVASPLVQLHRGSEQSTPIQGSRNSTGFDQSFDPDSVKVEDPSDLPNTYPFPRESTPGCCNVSQGVSPTVEISREAFEHNIYHVSGTPDAQSHHSVATMAGLQNQRHHQQSMQHWSVTLAPDLFISAPFASHSSFEPSSLTIEEPMSFGQVTYHNTPSSHRQNTIHGLSYAGPRNYQAGFSMPDHSGLPMRPLSGLRPNLAPQDMGMISDQNTYYNI